MSNVACSQVEEQPRCFDQSNAPDLRALLGVWNRADEVLAVLAEKVGGPACDELLESSIQDLLTEIARSVAAIPAETSNLLALKMAMWRRDDTELSLAPDEISRAHLLAYSVFRDLVALSGESGLLNADDLKMGSRLGLPRLRTSLPRSSSSYSSSAICEIAKRFGKLREESAADAAYSGELAEVSSNPAAHQMFLLAWRAAELAAETTEDLRRKSEILAEYAEEDPTDLVKALIQSVCRDIQALFGASDGEDQICNRHSKKNPIFSTC